MSKHQKCSQNVKTSCPYWGSLRTTNIHWASTNTSMLGAVALKTPYVIFTNMTHLLLSKNVITFPVGFVVSWRCQNCQSSCTSYIFGIGFEKAIAHYFLLIDFNAILRLKNRKWVAYCLQAKTCYKIIQYHNFRAISRSEIVSQLLGIDKIWLLYHWTSHAVI